MVQRYKFESKSQRVPNDPDIACSCFQWFKDTNLKVNHNLFATSPASHRVVSNGSKIQI